MIIVVDAELCKILSDRRADSLCAGAHMGTLMPAKVRELRRKAALCRRAAGIPTAGSWTADCILVALAGSSSTMPRSESANCRATHRSTSLMLVLPDQNHGAVPDRTPDQEILVDL